MEEILYTTDEVEKILLPKDKEIERLRKEKEWLIENYALARMHIGVESIKNTRVIRDNIREEMQQSLKEGS